MNDKLRFNINSYVYIKIKPAGYILWQSWYKHSIVSIDDLKKQADKDGYTGLQMHHFMEVFGKVMYIGVNPYFETDILFNKKDLTNHP